MRTGDMVRFRVEMLPRNEPNDCVTWEWKVGLLVEYHAWEKIATILYEGKIYRIAAYAVQKAGKKDFSDE